MKLKKPLNIAVLGSGKGSNFQALAQAVNERKLNAKIVCVCSDVHNSLILKRAKALEISAEYIDHSPYKTKLAGQAEVKMIEHLQAYDTELIVLAGYMRILKERLLETFPRRIINIHPSLLPAFRGLEAWKQALDYGVKITGCTVHFVDKGMDTGPIILQKPVPVYEKDTPETLHARIQKQEHVAYVEAIQKIIRGEAAPKAKL